MRLLCFLAAFLLTAGLQAQIDYLPGYYIGVGGVKKECFIKSSVSADITKNLFYKLTESGPENEMRLHEVFEFGIYGRAVYKKFTVDIDKSTTEISRLRTSNTPQWEPETLFLKLVVHGKIDLYETASRNNKYFYFSEGMEKPVQLLYIEYTDANDSKILRYDYTFRKQLYELMGDKGYPVTQFRKLEYKKKPLVKLFLTYNGITPGQNSNEKDDPGKISFKLTPGYGQSSIAISKMHKENWGHSKSGVSAYRIGAEFEYYPPGLDNKWSLFLDPNYQILKHEFEYREVYLSQNPKFNWKITNNLFEVPLGVRYHMYFNKSTKVFVNAAYNFYAISGSSNAIFQRRELYTTANDIDETMDIKTPARFGLGAGVSYRMLSLEARMAFGESEFEKVDRSEQSITYRSRSVEGKISTFFVVLGYKFL